MEKWTELLKDNSQASRRYPLQVTAGRWGSIDSAESFFIQRGRQKIETVLLAVLSKYMKLDKTVEADEAKAKPAPKPTLDDNEESMQAYRLRLKLSKWTQATFDAVTSSLFWFCIFVAYKARSPWRRFYLTVQKYSSDHCMYRLVTDKIEKIKQQFDDLVSSLPDWFQQALDFAKDNSEGKALP
jgi:hypothetical protein